MNVTQTVEELEGYPVNLRYPRESRNRLEELRQVRVETLSGVQVPLAQVADIEVISRPPAIKNENARLNS